MKIDLDAILYNYRHLKCYYKKNVIAVLKDNAYGIGLLKVANVLKNESGIIIAINKIEDIVLLRKNGYDKDILYLNVFEEKDLDVFIKYNVSVIVQSLKQLNQIKNKNVPFHLKVNTGMNRLGIYDYELEKTIKLINNDPSYNMIGIMSHFATNDLDHTCYNRFKEIVAKIKKDNLIIHCFASGSLNEYFPNISTHIRIGLKLYGIGDRNSFLHNVITIHTPILEIKKIKKDELVGYNYTFKSNIDGYLYILPIGYGQGYGRFKKSIAYVDNIYLKQAGNISMDYATFFSSYLIDINMEVELIGKKISLEELAFLNDIDCHELLIRFNTKKEYHKLSLK